MRRVMVYGVTDSILLWHFRSFARKRARIRRWQSDPDFPEIVVLRSAAEVERWLSALGPADSKGLRPTGRRPEQGQRPA